MHWPLPSRTNRVGRLGLFGVISITLLTGFSPDALTSRAPLDVIWERHMLNGMPANIYVEDGHEVARATGSTEPFEPTRGNPASVTYSKEGIIVTGPQETRMLGLRRHGGWSLHGGRLQRLAAGDPGFELYGKHVIWTAPYFPFPFHRGPQEQQWSYEFFLLKRDQTGRAAQIIRKWVFEPPMVILGPPGRYEVSADMKRDPSAPGITVTVHGLAKPFEERVAF